MPKTSLQLYQQINAVDSADRDQTVTQELLKDLALAAANAAKSLESTTLFHNGPTVTPTAASLYTAVDNIDESDRDPVTMQELLKKVALLMAKIAMQLEALRTGIGPQIFQEEGEVSVTVAPSISFGPNDFIRGYDSASITTAAEILSKFARELGDASVTATPSIELMFNRELEDASVTATPSISFGPNVFVREFSASTIMAAEAASV